MTSLVLIISGLLVFVFTGVAVRITEGKWLWPISASQSRKLKSFLSKLLSWIPLPGLSRQSSPTGSLSPQSSPGDVTVTLFNKGGFLPPPSSFHARVDAQKVAKIFGSNGSPTHWAMGTVASPTPGEREQRERDYPKHVASLEKVPGAMRLFRAWQLKDDGTLASMVTTYDWVPGENVATSMAHPGNNGFYGFSSLAELQAQEPVWWAASQSGQSSDHASYMAPLTSVMAHSHYVPSAFFVSGTFLGYGHIKVATKGGRAARAVPEYIVEPTGADLNFGLRVATAAEKYGMKIISVKQARSLKPGPVPWWKGKATQ